MGKGHETSKEIGNSSDASGEGCFWVCSASTCNAVVRTESGMYPRRLKEKEKTIDITNHTKAE